MWHVWQEHSKILFVYLFSWFKLYLFILCDRVTVGAYLSLCLSRSSSLLMTFLFSLSISFSLSCSFSLSRSFNLCSLSASNFASYCFRLSRSRSLRTLNYGTTQSLKFWLCWSWDIRQDYECSIDTIRKFLVSKRAYVRIITLLNMDEMTPFSYKSGHPAL